MPYAEKVPSRQGAYWRGRFKDGENRWVTVRDDRGQVIRFTKKADARTAAADREADVRGKRYLDPLAGRVTFGEWASEWYAGLDLAPSTMANLRRHLLNHLLPYFEDMALADIGAAAIRAWERQEAEAGAAAASIRTWRGTLHTVLQDATGRHIGANPAARQRGRGRRSGRKNDGRAPEKVITAPLGVLLIAERMAILSGRDDEFVMVQAAFWAALRLGELTGLDEACVKPKGIRVEWQLQEVEGTLVHCQPKDGSRGTVDAAPFLRGLLAGQQRRPGRGKCPCHGRAFMFGGLGVPRGRGNMPLRVLASAAGVSETVVQSALGGRGRISADARDRVLETAREIGYRPGTVPAGPAAHWRRSSFEEMFTAAASGWFPQRAPLPRRPVPLDGGWPGARVRGRNAQGRAAFCWLPVAAGLTPHGLRHSMKTWMEENGIPEVLSEAHLRHDIPGVSGVYRHVTPPMRAALAQAMTGAQEAALDARLAMSQRSPVAVLDGLLRERLEARKPRLAAVRPQEIPREGLSVVLGSDVLPGRGGRI